MRVNLSVHFHALHHMQYKISPHLVNSFIPIKIDISYRLRYHKKRALQSTLLVCYVSIVSCSFGLSSCLTDSVIRPNFRDINSDTWKTFVELHVKNLSFLSDIIYKVSTYFSKLTHIYFHENPCAISRTVPDAQADGRP